MSARLPTTLSGTHGVEPDDNRTNVEIRHGETAPSPPVAEKESDKQTEIQDQDVTADDLPPNDTPRLNPRSRFLRVAILLAGCIAATSAFGQSAVLQGGPWSAGHIPQYVGQGSSQPIVQDGGPAGGGAVGVNPSELGLTARGTGAAPYAGQGSGPYGTNSCDYDAPINNATGYHFFCLSANAQGGGLLAYGAGGTASALPLSFIVNGATYAFPFTIGGIVGPSISVVNDAACWNNTTGTLLKIVDHSSRLAATIRGPEPTILPGRSR